MERRGSRWSRRAFVVGAGGLGLFAGCGRLPGQAQPVPPKVARIGWFAPSTVPGRFEAFQRGLRELGYTEGQNLIIEVRTTEGDLDRLPALATDLVQLPVDVIVAIGSEAIEAAKLDSHTIPIVFAAASDPVSTGLVDSLARPGGNVTGSATLVPQLSGKRLELLKESVAGLSSVAYLWNPSAPSGPLNWKATEGAAQALGLRLVSLELTGEASSLEFAFEAAVKQGADGLASSGGAVNRVNLERTVALAAKYRLPAVYPWKDAVLGGGLMSYAANELSMAHRAAYYVDRILKGTRPADLPVEQPMTFDFVVNLKTAQALGITFPNEILLQVTEVIQ
jgi:putative tryptophan/tyrosine transport system substrate-binding protein